MIRKLCFLGIGAFFCLLIGGNTKSGEPPKDTVYARYIITQVNKEAYFSFTDSNGIRFVTIVVPPNAKPGDVLLGAKVWDGLEKVFIQAGQDMDSTKQDIEDLRGILLGLDSLRIGILKKK